MATKKPKVAVYKFASCDGCQLSLLDAEDELLSVAQEIDIAFFPEASRRMLKGPYDITFVEGSITTPHDAEKVRLIRKESKYVITIGACATAGGIQALRNWKNIKEFIDIVYATPEFISTLERSLPVSSFIRVDYELRGCPINKYELLELINALLNNRKPNIHSHNVCVECKLKGTVCIAVAKGIMCLGPVTHAGCGAICPSYHRGCYGCFGPSDSVNTASLSKHYLETGENKLDIMLAFRNFNCYAEPFRKESEANEKYNNQS